MNEFDINIFQTGGVLFLLSFLPFIVVMGTSFTKISIVLMLLRNALGVQQAPSGIVINSIALVLTLFISFPLGFEIIDKLQNYSSDLNDWDNTKESARVVLDIVAEHLQKNSLPRETKFFEDTARIMWPEELHIYAHADNLLVLLPAHITSEITRAFEISFLLFLPFVIVDLIVSNILLAMGAMMVPPMLISLPVKLLLFVSVDGWTKLLHSLILSYL